MNRNVFFAWWRRFIRYRVVRLYLNAGITFYREGQLAAARALMNKPDIIFADEPTGSLDSKNRAELQELFFQLRRDLGQTFVIVTHDEAFAQQCDRCIHMMDGKISDDEHKAEADVPVETDNEEAPLTASPAENGEAVANSFDASAQ